MQEAILHSLKGLATNWIQFLGPNATVKTILQTLETVYGTVVNYETLITNIDKVIQDTNDKRQLFLIKLEGVLDHIRTKFIAKLGKRKVQGDLRDYLFHGMKKTLRDPYTINMIIPT